MKFLFVGYIVLCLVVFFFSIIHQDDVNKDGVGKFNWRFVLLLIMFIVSPVVAKFCGLI